MALAIKDGNAAAKSLKSTLDGSDHVTHVNVDAIAAGDNNIGNVDIASIAAGDNNIGNVDVVTLPALPAGTNNIGDVDIASIAAGDNNIGNVDIASALPAGDNNIGNVDVVTLPALPAGTNSIGEVVVNPGSTMAYGNGTCNGSAQQLIVGSTVPKNGIVLVSTHPDNDEEIYIGDASVADETGLSIAAGATVPIPTDNVNKLYIRGKTTTCKYSWYCNK